MSNNESSLELAIQEVREYVKSRPNGIPDKYLDQARDSLQSIYSIIQSNRIHAEMKRSIEVMIPELEHFIKLSRSGRPNLLHPNLCNTLLYLKSLPIRYREFRDTNANPPKEIPPPTQPNIPQFEWKYNIIENIPMVETEIKTAKGCDALRILPAVKKTHTGAKEMGFVWQLNNEAVDVPISSNFFDPYSYYTDWHTQMCLFEHYYVERNLNSYPDDDDDFIEYDA